jgi:competence protein ComEC
MDLVQYRLERLDRRNEGLPGQFRRLLETTPLAFCAIGLISGIVIENYLCAGLGVWLSILGVGIVIGVAGCVWSPAMSRPAIIAIAASLAFASLGGIRFMDRARPPASDVSSIITSEGSIADIRGYVAGPVHVEDRSGWDFARFVRGDLKSGFDLELAQVRCVDGWHNVTGTVRVVVGEPVYDIHPGQPVQLYAFLTDINGQMNPGSFDAKAFYWRLGIAGAAFVDSRAAIDTWQASQPQSMAGKFQSWLRSTAANTLKWGRWQHDETDGLLEAFLLGTRSDITPETYEAFRRTGLLHYVSLSGMNIAIVIGAVWWFSRTIGITRRRRAILCILGILLFLILVPMQSPILRAGFVGIVFCAEALLRRRTEPINSLALAAIIILLASPLELFSVGWQLSFGCVLGILLFCRPLEFAFYDTVSRITRRNISLDDLHTGLAGWLIRNCVLLMATGTAAWLGGGGFMLYHFYNITPLATLWTAITSPLMSVITILGYIKMILSAILPTAGAVLAPVMAFLAWLFIWAVTLMSRVRLSEILIGHVPVWLIVLFYAAILYFPLVYWPRGPVKKVANLLLIMAFVISLGIIRWQRVFPSSAEITLLSVGHGQAVIARLPSGNYLFDCGSMTIKDCGRKTVLPFLRWEGIEHLDGVFISHTDIDHCNGIGQVIAACHPEDAFDSLPLKDELRSYGKDELLRKSAGPVFHPVSAGKLMERHRSGMRVLWPDSSADIVSAGDNDKSLVSLIEFGGRRVLISSDIQQHAQREMLALYPNLRADVVISPHHGSATSLYRDFYRRLDPNAIVTSCDDTQQQRALRSKALPASANTYFTSRDGAVTITIGADSTLSIETFVGTK